MWNFIYSEHIVALASFYVKLNFSTLLPVADLLLQVSQNQFMLKSVRFKISPVIPVDNSG